MDYGTILTDSKWNIIKELSEKEQTPTELADKTKTTLANISQQLRLLEAYGIVKKERTESSKKPESSNDVVSDSPPEKKSESSYDLAINPALYKLLFFIPKEGR